jgi:hypothetical protein
MTLGLDRGRPGEHDKSPPGHLGLKRNDTIIEMGRRRQTDCAKTRESGKE